MHHDNKNPDSAGIPAIRKRPRESFWRRHGLGITSLLILTFWFVLYLPANPQTHSGGFFGNAIADWSGVVVTVYGTKYLYEIGSAESRQPRGLSTANWKGFLKCHSLTIFLAITGLGWLWLYLRVDSNSKWGQVTGNILSEWTQIVGLVILTKRLIERGSKE